MSRFQNWSGSVHFTPSRIVAPRNESALAEVVRSATAEGKKIRVVGTGHSFTPLIETPDILVSLDRLQGIVDLDSAGVATVWGGTKIKRLTGLLFSRGRLLENQGDIDRQSIAGAISTGTHGTGEMLGNVSSQVVGLRILLANGEFIDCSESENSDVFSAALVSLGALGILTRVRIRTLPAYRLKLVTRRQSLDSCLSEMDRLAASYRHFEFYYFPFTRIAQTKCSDVLPEGEWLTPWWVSFLNEVIVENVAFSVLTAISRLFPSWTRGVSRVIGRLAGQGIKKNWAHRVFATPRWVRFQEMEYNIPRRNLKAVLTELIEMIERDQIRVQFPIECRVVKADRIWLSPSYARDSAYVAVHMAKGMSYFEYFQKAEAIFTKYAGRPHWGKMHGLTSSELRALYPMWDRFQKVRRRLDPSGTFSNDATRRLFQ